MFFLGGTLSKEPFHSPESSSQLAFPTANQCEFTLLKWKQGYPCIAFWPLTSYVLNKLHISPNCSLIPLDNYSSRHSHPL